MTHAALKDHLESLRGLAAVIRKHGTCAPAAIEEVADRIAALSAMEGEASLRLALRRIADYEGDPLTPVRNSAKKSQIARNALEPMSQFDSFWENAAAYEREADAFCNAAPPPQQAEREREAFIRGYKHGACHYIGGNTTEELHDAACWAVDHQSPDAGVFPTPSPGPQGGGEFEAWFARQDCRLDWKEIVRLAYLATPPAHQPGEVVTDALRELLRCAETADMYYGGEAGHTEGYDDWLAAMKEAKAALAPKDSTNDR